MADDGRFVVVWQSGNQPGDDSSYGIFAQRYDASGQPSWIEFQVNTYTTDTQRDPEVAMAGDGRFAVVWISHNQIHTGGDSDIFAQCYNSLGGFIGSEIQVNTYTTGRQSGPSIGMAHDGRFVVAWHSPQGGSGNGVFAQRYDALGQPDGVELQVNTYTTGGQQSPAVAMADDGQYVVAWTSDTQPGDGDDLGIFAQRYDSLGQPDGVEIQVNTYTTGDQKEPAVAMADDGRYVVVWQSDTQPGDGDGYGIFAQRYDALGQPDGAELQVNTYTTHAQRYPKTAMSGDGRFVAAWQSYGQDSDNYGIFFQKYDTAGAPLGLLPW